MVDTPLTRGVLQILAALQVGQLGSILETGEIQGKVYQDAWNLKEQNYRIFVYNGTILAKGKADE